MNQRDLIDILYMIVTSMRGIAAKLDADGSVTLTTYLANVDALFNFAIEDSRGNYLNLGKAESSTLPPTFIIGPKGIDNRALIELLYMIFNAWETMCEQLDGDGNPPTNTDYEAIAYTAIYLKNVMNGHGNTLGNGTVYTFTPHGVTAQWPLVDLLYMILDGIETFTEQADTDAAPADSNYEALWFTANITLTVENSSGDRVGN